MSEERERLLRVRNRALLRGGTLGVLFSVLVVMLFLFAGCAVPLKAVDTLLTARDRITERTVDNTVAGAERYCRAFGAERRAKFRAGTDRGEGPIIEIHCDRVP